MDDADFHDQRANQERAFAADAATGKREVHIALALCHANAAWLIREARAPRGITV